MFFLLSRYGICSERRYFCKVTRQLCWSNRFHGCFTISCTRIYVLRFFRYTFQELLLLFINDLILPEKHFSILFWWAVGLFFADINCYHSECSIYFDCKFWIENKLLQFNWTQFKVNSVHTTQSNSKQPLT